MYLAEDRILCWELVSKRGCKWKLHYVKSASATTDVPDAVGQSLEGGDGGADIRDRCRNWCLSVEGELNAGLRVVRLCWLTHIRWLNGSFFAAIHSIVHFGYLYRSSCVCDLGRNMMIEFLLITCSHSFTRKFFLHIDLVYRECNIDCQRGLEADLRAETVNLVFSWFALGNFYIAFVVLTVSERGGPTPGYLSAAPEVC
jgi:chitin synthase